MSSHTGARKPCDLLVADSFRVRRDEHGRAEVRGWDRHLARFMRSVRAVTSTQEASAFLRRAAHEITEYGEGFPRLELWRTATGTLEFHTALRPLPPIGATIEMRSAPGVQVPQPGIKGPNIHHLGDLCRTLNAEALLLDPEGNVLEGATTSVVWWDPQIDIGFVAPSTRAGLAARVPSITESLIRDAAPELTPAQVTPHTLRHYEVWAVNALHGIRVVSSLDGVSLRAPNTARLEALSTSLDRSWQLVTPPA